MISDKKPSAYAAMKHGGGHDVITHVGSPEPEPAKKKGRPSKEEVRKHKLAMASDRIAILVESKLTKAKIREYFQSRIMELDEERR